MPKKPLHIGTSPLTNRIYAGHVLKDGQTWAADKEDVTGAACAAVAQHVLKNDDPVVVTANGKPKYEITAKDLQSPIHAPAPKDAVWVVHLIGPDDVIDQPDELTALREANKLNIGLARRRAEDPSDNDPHCWAVVKDASVESV